MPRRRQAFAMPPLEPLVITGARPLAFGPAPAVTPAAPAAWEGLGTGINPGLSPADTLIQAKLDWTVSKRALFMSSLPPGHDALASAPLPVPGKYMLTRDSDNEQFSIVGRMYRPVQNAVAMEFFKKFTDAGQMRMEAAGALNGGRIMWALARINRDFHLGAVREDEVRGYVLLCSPHVLNRGMIIQFMPIRTISQTTLAYTLGRNLRNREGAFRMPHSMEFDDRARQRAEQALGLSQQQMDSFEQAAQYLMNTRMHNSAARDYFLSVLRVDPEDAPDGEEPRMVRKFIEVFSSGPGADIATARGTLWGAFNAVLYVIDHQTGHNRDTALTSAWLGDRALVKRRAFNMALALT